MSTESSGTAWPAPAQGFPPLHDLSRVPRETVRTLWLRSGLFRPERLVTLPHAVGLAALPPLPPRDRSDGRLVLCTWGHLAPAKGVLDLLAAMHLVRDERLSLLVHGLVVAEIGRAHA